MLALAIADVLGMRPSARDALAQRARRHVEAHFSLERMAYDTLDVYTALLGALEGSKRL
jgi:glycosyltransferase involved in cell wall biosynthesis